MTDEQHNRYIAYAFLAHGAFQLLMTLFIGLIFFVFLRFPTPPGDPAPPDAFLAAFFGMMLFFQAVFMAPSFIAAYALIKQKSWARVTSIIAAVMSAMNVPIGTAACVYALWFFLGDNWKNVYQVDVDNAGVPHGQLEFREEPSWHAETADRFRFDEATTPPDWR